MATEAYKMYVSVVHQHVLTDKHASPWEYEVVVPRHVVPIFQHLFDQVERLEFRNFLRSHLPYVPYHYDQDNHDIDRRMMKVYALIHEYTDADAQQFIEQLPYFR